MSNLIMSAGIILLSLGAFMKYQEVSGKTELKDKSNLPNQEEVKPEEVVKDTVFVENVIQQPIVQNKSNTDQVQEEITQMEGDQLSPEEKGVLFEKFVVKKFSKKYFTIKEWRGDKFVEGVYADSNKLPDMEIELKLHNNIVKFAVECKWRYRFNKNQFELKEYNLKNYREFEKEKNIPVFIVVGIGGKPSLPELMYVIPLKEIKKNIIVRRDMTKYLYEDIKKDFYYDVRNTTLECGYY